LTETIINIVYLDLKIISKAKSIISNLIDRNSQKENIIVIFQILQNYNKINLYIENSFELSILKVIAIFYYIVSITFLRRLKEITKFLLINNLYSKTIYYKKEERTTNYINKIDTNLRIIVTNLLNLI